MTEAAAAQNEAQLKFDKDRAESLCISQLTSKQQRQQAAKELERIAEADRKANSMENRALKAIEEAVRSPQCRHVSKARGHEVAVRHGFQSDDVVFLNNLGTYFNRCGTSWCWTLIDTVSVVIRDTELHGDAATVATEGVRLGLEGDAQVVTRRLLDALWINGQGEWRTAIFWWP